MKKEQNSNEDHVGCTELNKSLAPDFCDATKLPEAWEQKAAKIIMDFSSDKFNPDTRSRANLIAKTLLECAAQLRRSQHGV